MPRWTRSVNTALETAAQRYNIPFEWLREIARVESSGNPHARGLNNHYLGLFQLTQSDFRRLAGPGADIFDPGANALAAARRLSEAREWHVRRFGESPTLGQLYMIHNQGQGGYEAHRRNPEGLAWVNMAGTLEGRTRGEDWAQRAVRLNVPGSMRSRANNLTSAEVMASFDQRFVRPARQDASNRNLGVAGNAPDPGFEGDTTPPSRRPSNEWAGRVDREERDVATKPDPDVRYPVSQALYGKDEPLGRLQLESIFGSQGLSQNRALSRGLSSFGSSLAKSANQAPPQLQIAPQSALPEQDPRAFALLPMRRQRYA